MMKSESNFEDFEEVLITRAKTIEKKLIGGSNLLYCLDCDFSGGPVY